MLTLKYVPLSKKIPGILSPTSQQVLLAVELMTWMIDRQHVLSLLQGSVGRGGSLRRGFR